MITYSINASHSKKFSSLNGPATIPSGELMESSARLKIVISALGWSEKELFFEIEKSVVLKS